MASKKSKILAMALCASVMTGIYASPVMAAGQISGITLADGSTTLVANDQILINGVELSYEEVKAKGGNFTQLTVTDGMGITGGKLTVGGTIIDSADGNTVVGGTLTATKAAYLNGGLTVTGDTVINSGRLFANEGLTVSSHGISIEPGGNLSLEDGDVYVGGTLDVNGETTLKNTEVNGTLTAGATTVDSLTVNGAAKVNSLEVANGIKAANGTFQLTDAGVLTVGGKATFTDKVTVMNGLSVAGGASVDGNFAVTNGGLSVSGGESVLNGGLTVNNGDTKLNGKLDVGAGNFEVDKDGNTEFNGNLNIGHDAFEVTAADGSFSAARENFKVSADGVINADSLYLQTYGGGTLEVGEALQALTDAKLPDKVGGIERDPAGAGDPGDGTTTIENGAEFTETAMTMGDTIVESGKITVGAEGDQTVIEGGAITAKSLLLDGKNVGETIFGIERVGDVTTIEGATSFDANGMSIKDVGGFGTSLGVAGMEITAAGDFKTSFTAGGATFVGASASDTTTINGGAIQTNTINGVNFTQWHDEVGGRLDKLEYKTQNINGSEGTTAGGDSDIEVPATEDGHTGINGDVTVGGDITAGGTITTGETTIDGSGINTGNGNFTDDVDVDGEVTVGDGTTITGEGITTGNGNFTGDVAITGDITADNGNFAGDVDVDGKVTVGDNTTITDGNINLGRDNGTNINADGMTVGTGENATSITNDTVKAQNGDFDNLTAGSGTFGTGNNKTVINNDGVTVGGENGSSITGEGITVGDKNGVSIKNDEVRVGGGEDGKGGSYMNDTDVVTGEGVSLNQTAERVGHLENRVGKLEDRIDKVGAMSAAIANLRTMGYDPAAPTEVAVGVGQYRDETGMALGLFHYPNRDFMLSLSVSTSGDEYMGGIGATWKFGRKSPEKVAEIKKAQAEADARRAEEQKLAKAEEMKQAAKEAKIKAQQERHAKLAAERAAQAEAAK